MAIRRPHDRQKPSLEDILTVILAAIAIGLLAMPALVFAGADTSAVTAIAGTYSTAFVAVIGLLTLLRSRRAKDDDDG